MSTSGPPIDRCSFFDVNDDCKKNDRIACMALHIIRYTGTCRTQSIIFTIGMYIYNRYVCMLGRLSGSILCCGRRPMRTNVEKNQIIHLKPRVILCVD
jgi:hypothetical protein